jgi:hypothetical protein
MELLPRAEPGAHLVALTLTLLTRPLQSPEQWPGLVARWIDHRPRQQRWLDTKTQESRISMPLYPIARYDRLCAVDFGLHKLDSGEVVSITRVLLLPFLCCGHRTSA